MALVFALRLYKENGVDLNGQLHIIGAFRCGNKPLVLPGEEKRAKLQKKGEAKPSPKRLQKEKDLQYNGSGLATALPKYRRFFK